MRCPSRFLTVMVVALFLAACHTTDTDPVSFNDRGMTYAKKGLYDRAIQDFDQAIRGKPDHAAAFNNRGMAYSEKGLYDRAIQDYDQAIRLKPDYAAAFSNRGIAYMQKGLDARAIQNFDQTIRLEPDYVVAQNNKAWLLATAPEAHLRDGAAAVRAAERAVRLKDSLEHRDTLAAAYAEAGRFADAVREQEKAIAMLRSAGRTNDIPDFESRLDLYRTGRPYREK